jgi:hypothetical protein
MRRLAELREYKLSFTLKIQISLKAKKQNVILSGSFYRRIIIYMEKVLLFKSTEKNRFCEILPEIRNSYK